MTTRQAFELARFNVISAAFSLMAECNLDTAYVYAWWRRIFPFDIPSDYAKAFEDEFMVGAAPIQSLAEHLDDIWRNGKPVPTFFEIEGDFVHAFGAEWTRTTLVFALRYFFLRQMFDANFFKAILADAPAEIAIIRQPFYPIEEIDIF